MTDPEISLDDDLSTAAPAHERVKFSPRDIYTLIFDESTPAGIGARHAMSDRKALAHDLYGEHPPAVRSRADFIRFAAVFQFTADEMQQAADAWERFYYCLDRVRALHPVCKK